MSDLNPIFKKPEELTESEAERELERLAKETTIHNDACLLYTSDAADE